jgi:hypothetical protein
LRSSNASLAWNLVPGACSGRPNLFGAVYPSAPPERFLNIGEKRALMVSADIKSLLGQAVTAFSSDPAQLRATALERARRAPIYAVPNRGAL